MPPYSNVNGFLRAVHVLEAPQKASVSWTSYGGMPDTPL